MKRNFIFTACLSSCMILLAAIASLFPNSSQFLLHFVNIMFYISLPLILIGGFLFLLEGGSFNITRYTFHKTGFFSNPKEEAVLAEAEEKINDKELLYKTYSFPFTYPIIFTGICILLLSSIISVTVFL